MESRRLAAEALLKSRVISRRYACAAPRNSAKSCGPRPDTSPPYQQVDDLQFRYFPRTFHTRPTFWCLFRRLNQQFSSVQGFLSTIIEIPQVTGTRSVSFIEITLSKIALDEKDKGYQPPLPDDQVQELDPEEMLKGPRRILLFRGPLWVFRVMGGGPLVVSLEDGLWSLTETSEDRRRMIVDGERPPPHHDPPRRRASGAPFFSYIFQRSVSSLHSFIRSRRW